MSPLLVQFGEQRLRCPQIRDLKTFGEFAVGLREDGVPVRFAVGIAKQFCQARGSAQLERAARMLLRERDGLSKSCFRRRRIAARLRE